MTITFDSSHSRPFSRSRCSRLAWQPAARWRPRCQPAVPTYPPWCLMLAAPMLWPARSAATRRSGRRITRPARNSSGRSNEPRLLVPASSLAPVDRRPRRTAPAVASVERWMPADPPKGTAVLSPEVVARDAEFAALERSLASATRGTGSVLLVSGEAGVGKTALVRAFAERARQLGANVIVGECAPGEARHPFGPIVEILRDLKRTLPGLALDASAGQVDDGHRYRMYELVSSIFLDNARERPLVVQIEDLHWADAATLELLPYLARKTRGKAVLILATYRSDELHRLHPLNDTIADLVRGRLADSLEVRSLTVNATGELIRAALRLKAPPAPQFLRTVHARSGGNPFFIEELVRGLVDDGELRYQDGGWSWNGASEVSIPGSLRAVVMARMRPLASTARRALQVGAVIGEQFSFELLRRVSGLSEDEVTDALRAGVDAQIVIEQPRSDGDAYAFRHQLTREIVLSELLRRERRHLHLAIGRALEETATTDENVEDLAYHFDVAATRSVRSDTTGRLRTRPRVRMPSHARCNTSASVGARWARGADRPLYCDWSTPRRGPEIQGWRFARPKPRARRSRLPVMHAGREWPALGSQPKPSTPATMLEVARRRGARWSCSSPSGPPLSSHRR